MDSAASSTSSNPPASPQGLESADRIGTTTSPSSVGTPSSQRRTNSTASPFSSETLQFLSNLDNYLALGCLCFEDRTDPTVEAEDWLPVDTLPPESADDPAIFGNVQKLAAAGWIRILSRRSSSDTHILVYRLYILPFDVGHRFVDRQSKRLAMALESLVSRIDVSRGTWRGDLSPSAKQAFDPFATQDDGSLFWMFNKLPSPAPRVDNIKEKYSHEALEDLLDPGSVLPGLRTRLYPYQRRSAGLMLQRESVSTLDLDPRLEERTAPDGTVFYFGPRDFLFLRQPRYYEACKGGILSETMGLGKTVICLATILATKEHPPLIPAVYALPPVRPAVASLAQMAVSTINRKSIPWRVELDRIRYANGDAMESCRETLQSNPAHYDIPVEPIRWNRKTIVPPPKRMTLACTTLIVVPRNLCKQWQSEIKKHVDEGALRVLVMDDARKELPQADGLRGYDIVLFTRGRFEMEIKDGADDQGRRIGATQLLCRCPYIGATRTRDCTCLRTDDLYNSPLKHLHFKRLIIDEGHFFSNTNGTAVAVANKLVTADHRWVVSGTPAKDLLGVEVDMSASDNLWHTPNTKRSRDAVLEQRRSFSRDDHANGAIKNIGSLASNFLRIKPWYAPDMSDRKADWDEYVYRHEDSRKRTYSGFSTCLRRTLQAMVVKTQPEDVERDIELPPLSHEVVRLEPSFYDKLTANLFTLVLTANAVTSERTDVDYLFHKNSQKSRSQLIQNLRQSAFFWTGFSEADVQASQKSSNGYLEKEGTGCSESDRQLLTDTLQCAHVILQSQGWRALSRSHEIGLFVDGWPGDSAQHWAFDESHAPLMIGVSQLLGAQKHVNTRGGEEDPGEGLAGAGIRALVSTRGSLPKKVDEENQKAEKPILTKGIPTSSLDGEPLLRRRSSLKTDRSSPKKSPSKPKAVQSRNAGERDKVRIKSETNDSSSRLHRRDDVSPTPNDIDHPPFLESTLTPDSPFLQSKIVGTASAKLSYLISQILKYHQHEKILVFYDGDNVAYYIAQMLELLHIKHEIYAKTLAAHLKAEYVARFDQEAHDRVLLMDVRNAAYGLNLPSASRIFFVNPVCRPNIEAQAIKRAHRIGQTRKVFVETLVLKGTIEEKMLDRSRRMTRSEHHDAKALEDDGGIRQIIQSARLLPVFEHERHGVGQMAPLEEPQQLWGRSGWTRFTQMNAARPEAESKKRKMSQSTSAEALDEESRPKKKVAIRTLDFVDCRATAPETEKDGTIGQAAVPALLATSAGSSTPTPAVKWAVEPLTPRVTSPTLRKTTFPSPEFEPMDSPTDPSTYSHGLPVSTLLDNTPLSLAMPSSRLMSQILHRL